jgi:hypothetical protein
MRLVVSHPSRKNKDAARVGHPDLLNANYEKRVRRQSRVPQMPRGNMVPTTNTIIHGMLMARC